MVTPVPVMNASNMTNPGTFVQQAATAVPEGYFGLLILTLVMGIALRGLDHLPFSQRLLAMLGAGFISSIFLVGLGVLGVFWTELLLVLTMVVWFLTQN